MATGMMTGGMMTGGMMSGGMTSEMMGKPTSATTSGAAMGPPVTSAGEPAAGPIGGRASHGSDRRRKRVFVVGNGPLARDLGAEVEAADFVVRFNEPKAAKGMSGTRTDWLFLNNSGKPMQRRLADPGYVRSPIVAAARTVIFAYHPLTISRYLIRPNPLSWLRGRRANWTAAALDMFGRAGKEVLILPPAAYEEGCAELGLPAERMREVFPSTGFFGIRHVLRHCPAEEWDVVICGFTWQGWKRHAWADERAWLEQRMGERPIEVW